MLDNNFENYTGVKASVEAKFMTKATLRLVEPLCAGKRVLCMGLGNGLIAREVSDSAGHVTVIEGSEKILQEFRFASGNTTFALSLFEDYESEGPYDVVLANHVLEHVDDPVSLLQSKVRTWLSEDGCVCLSVPNAKSIHRLIGKEMGMLMSEYDLNKSDIMAGHKRVYDLASLKQDILSAGLRLDRFGGYNLKMVSLNQMSDWAQELFDAIFEVSHQLPPEICANIWAIARK